MINNKYKTIPLQYLLTGLGPQILEIFTMLPEIEKILNEENLQNALNVEDYMVH